MDFLTNEKLTIVGAAGMIGSNMAQTAMMMHLTPNICLYDPYAPALEGVAEELRHCAFENVNLTVTSDIEEALSGASYIVSSGGAARKAGMTREDLLKNIQPCRHNRPDYTLVFRTEAVASFHTCRTRQHTSAQRACKIFQDFAGQDS